jgi:hypothetical protein
MHTDNQNELDCGASSLYIGAERVIHHCNTPLGARLATVTQRLQFASDELQCESASLYG